MFHTLEAKSHFDASHMSLIEVRDVGVFERSSKTHKELEDDVERASQLGRCHLCKVDRPNHSAGSHSHTQHDSAHNEELYK